ncbi:MAG TPA: SAM-dependent methyltransferase [Leucothrix mucor]|nr:SAM-dependent methyltransferase [Leucothrix mucor]
MQEADYNSSCITSNQEGIHPKLEDIVTKHLNSQFRRPIAEHTQLAFDNIKEQVEASLKSNHASLIFDSCCGTALSTRKIAQMNPQSLVIGIDRSIKRLSKEYSESIPSNVILVQAECSDFWRLALQSGWRLDKHFLLYPNPYPKSSHLKRRWHAHPVYPSLLALGGCLELRTNWLLYAEEFIAALAIKNTKDTTVLSRLEIFVPDDYLTLFEKKYHRSGQELYRCLLDLNHGIT